jgi:hypothetical protein
LALLFGTTFAATAPADTANPNTGATSAITSANLQSGPLTVFPGEVCAVALCVRYGGSPVSDPYIFGLSCRAPASWERDWIPSFW